MNKLYTKKELSVYLNISMSKINLLLKNNSTTAVTINSSGNVGIGTTSPGGAKLDIVANSNAGAIQIRNRSGNDYGFIVFNSYDGSETSSAQIGA